MFCSLEKKPARIVDVLFKSGNRKHLLLFLAPPGTLNSSS